MAGGLRPAARPPIALSPAPCVPRQPLAELYEELRAQRLAVAVNLRETVLREYQVLPSRTHPRMNGAAASGFVLSGIRVAPPSAPPAGPPDLAATNQSAYELVRNRAAQGLSISRRSEAGAGPRSDTKAVHAHAQMLKRRRVNMRITGKS